MSSPHRRQRRRSARIRSDAIHERDSRKDEAATATTRTRRPSTVGSLIDCIEKALLRVAVENQSDLNKLTPANLASLRWDNPHTDPVLEKERIERYKELRRQRYIEARQQAIEILMEQMQLAKANETLNTTVTEQP